MEEKKKKKKLTLSVSFNKPHNVPRYTQGKGKTSVVIEKKSSKRWGEKNFNREIVISINLNQQIVLFPKKQQ